MNIGVAAAHAHARGARGHRRPHGGSQSYASVRDEQSQQVLQHQAKSLKTLTRNLVKSATGNAAGNGTNPLALSKNAYSTGNIKTGS